MQVAENDHARLLQPMDDRRVLVRIDIVSRGPKGGRNTLGLEQILEADRYAVQRSAPAPACDLGLCSRGLGQCAFAGHEQIGIELRIQGRNAVEHDFGQRNRRQIAPGNEVGNLHERRIVDRVSEGGSFQHLLGFPGPGTDDKN